MNTSPVPFSQGFCQKVTAPSVTSAVAWSRSCASCSFEAYLTSDARSAQPLARAIEARDALAALLPAIAHVHARKIIHTDITAANLLLERWPQGSFGGRRLLLADFSKSVLEDPACRRFTPLAEMATAQCQTPSRFHKPLAEPMPQHAAAAGALEYPYPASRLRGVSRQSMRTPEMRPPIASTINAYSDRASSFCTLAACRNASPFNSTFNWRAA